MSSKVQNSAHLIVLIILLISCAPAPALPYPTSISPQPTNAEAAIPGNQSSLFKSGSRYSDASGDMDISFLDVIGFQGTVHEESETLEVVLQLRDIPEDALRGQVKNLSEYTWMIFVFLDPSASLADMPGDYYFVLNTTADDLSSESLTPVPGTPVIVPIHQLFENRYVYDSSGISQSTVEVDVNPDRDRLTITGRVPGITSNAVFSFSTDYYDGTRDKPDGAGTPPVANLSTPLASATRGPSASEKGRYLESVGTVWAFPGPEHYAGDELTVAIQMDGMDNGFPGEVSSVFVALDDMAPREFQANIALFNQIVVPRVLDTTDLVGWHTLKITTADGDLNETYTFEVLPADQRPENEITATWMVRESDCCFFHFLSGTAAERDIDFIVENFEQGASDFESLMGKEIGSKMDIYLIDRMLYNGGFGGGGKLYISYTDRYFGPTMGSAGLQTLARHEFSHAADIGFENTGDGIDYNYEGLAVYVAGGHYKPEPLAQRGAALYDLGHYAPVSDFIPQHELSYLHAALLLTYIVETYGEDKLWEFFSADADTPDEQLMPMEDAIQATFGIPLAEFDQGFRAWLEKNDPGEQLEDLQLTIELQDARREYQTRYSPQPLFLVMEPEQIVTRPENLFLVLRETRAPANIAMELLIANAQRAIISGAYTEAETLIQSIKEVVSSGDFESQLAKEYLDVVLAAGEAGYEVAALNIQNGYATAQAIREPPTTTVLVFKNVNGTWQIEP
jgi:hypothetical protein